jgi:uncharacterized protein YegP (UPF0339 family)
MAHPAFQLKTAKDGQTYFTLTAGNGEVIGKSEMYTTKAAAENGIASVQKNAPNAEADGEKNPKFETKEGNDGKTYFNLTATNGEVILSSQGYASKDGAINGIESVKKNAPAAQIDDQTDQAAAA